MMSEGGNRYRSRAKDCRRLAALAEYEEIRTTLLKVAEGLEAEADTVEAAKNSNPS